MLLKLLPGEQPAPALLAADMVSPGVLIILTICIEVIAFMIGPQVPRVILFAILNVIIFHFSIFRSLHSAVQNQMNVECTFSSKFLETFGTLKWRRVPGPLTTLLILMPTQTFLVCERHLAIQTCKMLCDPFPLYLGLFDWTSEDVLSPRSCCQIPSCTCCMGSLSCCWRWSH